MKRTSRYAFAIAFGLSLLLHLGVVPLVRIPATPEPSETLGPIVLESPRRPSPTPAPTPRPTPAPVIRRTPAPTRSPQPARAPRQPPRRHAAFLSHQSSRPRSGPREARPVAVAGGTSGTSAGAGGPGLPGSAGAGPTAAPTSLPTPTPTHPPACSAPNVPAATLDPVVPDTPPLAQAQGISGDVTVIVSLDADSRIIDARIASSPSALLDGAALRAARASTFRTEIRDCRSVAADYAFIVEFSAQ